MRYPYTVDDVRIAEAYAKTATWRRCSERELIAATLGELAFASPKGARDYVLQKLQRRPTVDDYHFDLLIGSHKIDLKTIMPETLATCAGNLRVTDLQQDVIYVVLDWRPEQMDLMFAGWTLGSSVNFEPGRVSGHFQHRRKFNTNLDDLERLIWSR